jgi:hypothetical protein
MGMKFGFVAVKGKYGVWLYCIKFKVFSEVKMWILVFRVTTPCSFICGYQHFAGTYSFHLQSRLIVFENWMMRRVFRGDRRMEKITQ